MIKIFVVGGAESYASWIPNKTLVNSVAEADLVFLTGGTDVDSSLYGEPRHPQAEAPDINRDRYEEDVFMESVALGKHILGVCRGAQLACVLSGGKLVQHQRNTGRHEMISIRHMLLYEGSPHAFSCAADHHQAQFPWGVKDAKILTITWGESPFHEDGYGREMIVGYGETEVEDVFYPSTKALAIQSHPEWDDPNGVAVTHYRKLLELHLANKL